MKNSGFSMFELLITVTIIGVVMGFAIPSMTEFIKNDRLSTQINTMVGHLAYARNTAVTRHQQVVLCASDNLSTCSGNNWKDGWIIFVDADSDDDFTAGEEILRVHEALPDGSTLTSSLGASVVYDSRGFAPTSNGTFSLCDARGAEHMKSLSISVTGRVRQGGSNACA
jgi:type IV fimbrial biogenesis protein FimT